MDGIFKRRFRVSPAIFKRIYKSIHRKSVFYPADATDAAGKKVIHPFICLTAVFCTLAYGTPADCHDEQWQISEKVGNNQCFEELLQAVNSSVWRTILESNSH
jgi:hypothetical protein